MANAQKPYTFTDPIGALRGHILGQDITSGDESEWFVDSGLPINHTILKTTQKSPTKAINALDSRMNNTDLSTAMFGSRFNTIIGNEALADKTDADYIIAEKGNLISAIAEILRDDSLQNYQLMSAKGNSNGYAGLDSSKKLLMANMPDGILGQMTYAGSFVPTTGVATLTDNGKTMLGTSNATITLTNDDAPITGYKASQGDFYIASAKGNFAGISFKIGDWLVSTSDAWNVIKNSDAVASVNGKLDAVVLDLDDILDAAPVSNTAVATLQVALNNIVTAASKPSGLVRGQYWLKTVVV